MSKFSDIQAMLEAIPFENGEADNEAMRSVVSAIRQMDAPREMVPLLFRWFEAHSEHVVGSPGPFVHFIEEELDYFRALEESLSAKPTDHTAWMVNRIANGETDPTKAIHWVTLLKAVACHPLADEACKETAQDFISHQSGR